jgi:hypothetical protein
MFSAIQSNIFAKPKQKLAAAAWASFRMAHLIANARKQ